MGRKANNHPYQQLMEGPVYELHIDPITGARSFVPMGYLRSINGKPYGHLPPDWAARLQEHAPAQITKEMRNRIEAILMNYQMARAGELAAIGWKALHEALASITKAATALQSALDKRGAATAYLQQRLEELEVNGGLGFARDDFYPMLTQLTFRSRLLREELEREQTRGDRLDGKAAWQCFVYNMAIIFREMSGSRPTISIVTPENMGTVRHSSFTKFAFAAMTLAPEELRQHTGGGREGSMDTFAHALHEDRKTCVEV
jgi:hypothetical protein